MVTRDVLRPFLFANEEYSVPSRQKCNKGTAGMSRRPIPKVCIHLNKAYTIYTIVRVFCDLGCLGGKCYSAATIREFTINTSITLIVHNTAKFGLNNYMSGGACSHYLKVSGTCIFCRCKFLHNIVSHNHLPLLCIQKTSSTHLDSSSPQTAILWNKRTFSSSS